MQRMFLLISVFCVFACETPSARNDASVRASVFGDALFLPVIESEQVVACEELGVVFQGRTPEEDILESPFGASVTCVVTVENRASVIVKGYKDYLVSEGFEVQEDPYSADRLTLLCGELGFVSLDPAPRWDEPEYAVLESDSPVIELMNEKRLILAGYLPREAWAIPDAPCGMEG